jgi:DNA topoisomerase-1
MDDGDHILNLVKKILPIPKFNDQKVTSEIAATMGIDDFKKMIEAQIPGAFEKKVRAKSAAKAKTTTAKPKAAAKPKVTAKATIKKK